MVSSHWPHYPWGKICITHWRGSWMGPRVSLDNYEKWKIFCSCQEYISSSLVIQPIVTVLLPAVLICLSFQGQNVSQLVWSVMFKQNIFKNENIILLKIVQLVYNNWILITEIVNYENNLVITITDFLLRY